MVGRRTDSHIFKGEMTDLMEFFSLGMGKFPIGLWPDVAYGTIVIGSQQGNGNGLQELILFLLHPQLSIYKYFGLHPEMFGYPFDIAIGEQRSGGLTAVGAL